jgi:hypothetical protein
MEENRIHAIEQLIMVHSDAINRLNNDIQETNLDIVAVDDGFTERILPLEVIVHDLNENVRDLNDMFEDIRNNIILLMNRISAVEFQVDTIGALGFAE